jgi:hypothetical protein
MFTDMKDSVRRFSYSIWHYISAGKKRSFAGFSAKTNNEAVIVFAKLCIENSDNQCRT